MPVWKDHHRLPACRFGIAGDFLPASGLAPISGETWSGQADLISPLFQDLQFSIVNLECPVGVDGLAPRMKASLGDTFSSLTESLDYLDSLKATVIGIANNHLYDYEKLGAARTVENLHSIFSVCGFGRSLQEPPSICIRELPESVRVGIWAAARNLSDAATPNSIGIEPATRERAAQALACLTGSDVQCRVAFLHAGAEGSNYPDPEDAQFMEELAEMGFDVVAACHSHRISGYKAIERKNRFPAHCFYGLGSLTSGVLYSPLEHEGVLAAVSLDATGAVCEVEARPIHLDERGWGRVPSAEECASVVDRFRKVSAAIQDGSYRQAFYSDMSRDLLGTQWRDARIAFQRAGIRGILQKLGRMRPAHLRRLYHKALRA